MVRVRHWQLARRRDAFIGTGLRDGSGRAGTNLGTDLELRVTWTTSAWLQLDLGHDLWFEGSCFDDVPRSPSTDDTHYAYVAAQVRF